MNTQILLTSLSIDELNSVISGAISNEFQKQKPAEVSEQEDLMTLKEVAKLLNRSLVTIHAWKKQGLLPFYRIANKIYFKKSEIMSALKKIEKRTV